MKNYLWCAVYVIAVWGFAFGGLAWGDPPAVETPPMAREIGVDVLAWFVQQFGMPGAFLLLAWRAVGSLKQFRIPLEVTIHPDTMSRFRSRETDCPVSEESLKKQ